jgi:hypothetical protein
MQVNPVPTLVRENFASYNSQASGTTKNFVTQKTSQAVSSDQFVGVGNNALEEVAILEAKRENESNFMEMIAELYDTVWGIWENLDLTHFLPIKKRVKRNFKQENEAEEEGSLTETYA